MRVPKRHKEELRRSKQRSGPIYLTKQGIEKIHREIARIKVELPNVIATVQETREMGDLSENAAYQIAKGKMRGMQTRLLVLNERLKNVIEIQNDGSDSVQLGSVVTIKTPAGEKTYTIVDSLESDPANGFISWHSPLGKEMRNKKIGDIFYLNEAEYTVINIL